jgi:hypothetical protein
MTRPELNNSKLYSVLKLLDHRYQKHNLEKKYIENGNQIACMSVWSISKKTREHI